jgi:hypothetical protein
VGSSPTPSAEILVDLRVRDIGVTLPFQQNNSRGNRCRRSWAFLTRPVGSVFVGRLAPKPREAANLSTFWQPAAAARQRKPAAGLMRRGSSWPVLRDSQETELGAEHWGPVELMMGTLESGILLVPVDCEADDGINEDVRGDWFANLCFPDGPMIVHVYGGDDEGFVRTMARELQVRNVRLTFPAHRYEIGCPK